MNPLLNWAIQNGANPQAANNVDVTDESKIAAFEELYKKVCVSDVDRMREILKAYPKTTTKDSKISCLEALQYFVEDIDNAKSFVKIGGFPAILEALKSPDNDFVYWAAWIIASASQNNPEVQKSMFESNALDSLVKMLDEGTSSKVRAKIIYAISGIIKNYPEALSAFEALNGVSSLTGLLQIASTTELRKILHLLNRLCIQSDSIKNAMLKSNFFMTFDGIIQKEDDLDVQEKVADLLKTLVFYPASADVVTQSGVKSRVDACVDTIPKTEDNEQLIDILKQVQTKL
mmetsp:Transcript_475/g.553  ORF Transcript_475/g.553 Transcript_475/m.553 type:complete len:289 (+) Transcript_475:26-892(+)